MPNCKQKGTVEDINLKEHMNNKRCFQMPSTKRLKNKKQRKVMDCYAISTLLYCNNN